MPRSKRKVSEDQLRQVHKMSALNMPYEYMAAILGIPYVTFFQMIKTNKTLRSTISEGRAKTNNNVRVTLLEKAMGKPAIVDPKDNKVIAPAVEPEMSALKFWCETQEGFKKTAILEVPGLTEEDTNGLHNDDIEGRASALLTKLQNRIAKTKKK